MRNQNQNHIHCTNQAALSAIIGLWLRWSPETTPLQRIKHCHSSVRPVATAAKVILPLTLVTHAHESPFDTAQVTPSHSVGPVAVILPMQLVGRQAAGVAQRLAHAAVLGVVRPAAAVPAPLPALQLLAALGVLHASDRIVCGVSMETGTGWDHAAKFEEHIDA